MKTKSPERILFNRFLKENNCLKQFVRNHTNSKFSMTHDLSLMFCFKQNPMDYISVGFTWLGTDEGHKYWSKLEDKWQDYLSANLLTCSECGKNYIPTTEEKRLKEQGDLSMQLCSDCCTVKEQCINYEIKE